MSNENLNEQPGQPRKPWLTYAVLAAFITTMIIALVYGLNSGTRLGSRYTPLLDAIFHIKLNVTNAHLWFEEVVAGDEHESITEVRAYMDYAEIYVESVLEGRMVHMMPMSDTLQDDLRSRFIDLREEIKVLREITEERWQNKFTSAMGSELDEKYDAIFRGIIALTNEIEIHLELTVVDELNNFRLIQMMLISACCALLVFGIFLTRRQFVFLQQENTHRRRTEKELQKREAEAVAARKEAEASNKAKSIFLAKISHEIRTPINAVMGMTNMLSDTQQNKEQQEYTRLIHTSSMDLLEIINDLLDFSKIEVGKMTLEVVAFDLRQTVADVADLMIYKAREKSLELNVRIPANFPQQVYGDPVRLRQVLLNLVRNAIKFTHHGSISILISAMKETESDYLVFLSVVDTGIGIPAEKKEHIFDAFSQVDDTTTRRYQGAGLGLNICQQLVSMMDGSLEVDSAVGEGTSFTVRIPMRAGAEQKEKSQQAGTVHARNVLVIDSDEYSAEQSSEYLAFEGIRLEYLHDAQRTIETLEQAEARGAGFDAVLLGIPLETGDPVTTLTDIKDRAEFANIPVIIIASWAAPGLYEKYSTLGASAFITRAHRSINLIPLIDKLCSGESLAGYPAPANDGMSEDEPEKPVKLELDADVLLVEDNAVTQWAASHMLESFGCRVVLASNGKEGLESWRAGQFDLIFMDWQMPDMDGITVTKLIRQEEAGASHVPIVAFTANAMIADRKSCLDAGMDEHISKPIMPDALRKVLLQFLPSKSE